MNLPGEPRLGQRTNWETGQRYDLKQMWIDIGLALGIQASALSALLGSDPYTITNATPDRSYNANATTVDELADVVATLVSDLQAKGILS